ncbi:adenylosuccinate synthase [Pectobacterium carotovorum]|uniref:Adenylosuccinate synthetase n=1 Tax=Pectobacterium carotovorum TaxID=554 RepID=A0A419ARI9_PECCA|nr:adenylosuccinate synthase [Pectobacterium carotovorum]RJL47373.1 adenylosuccinate synthase [Pectobacterium carotovorum]
MFNAVVGLQFGDEGKGKFIDYLSHQVDHVARFNGGANAGHSVQYEGVRLAFSQLPATIRNKNLYICQGALISPEILYNEIEILKKLCIDSSIYIDPRCHVVLSLHAELNKASEDFKGDKKIGSVGKGVGACFEDKSNRHGIRLIDLTNEELLRTKLRFLWDIRDRQIKKVFEGSNNLDYEQIVKELLFYGEKLSPYFSFTNEKISALLKKNQDVLLETSQATFLDNAFGSYPYTVAYQTLVQSCFPMIGVPAHQIHVIGVMKAYMIRVGNGPFPTEIFDEKLHYIREKGNEYGTVSKRPRRCGWLDINLIKHAIELNGVNELAITNVDVLAGIDKIKIATSYLIENKKICTNTALMDFEKVTPKYTEFSGWGELNTHYNNVDELPIELVKFIEYIETECGIPVKYISYGPEREQTLIK